MLYPYCLLAGMPDVLPNTRPYIPRWGKDVIVNIGDPIDISKVLQNVQNRTALERRKVLTDFIQNELSILREKTLKLTEKVLNEK
jgi:monolysocardiolipin acyltransferase